MMSALDAVVRPGVPMALYTDRAQWAFYHTRRRRAPIDKTRLTQVGRALRQLGIEHMPLTPPKRAAAASG